MEHIVDAVQLMCCPVLRGNIGKCHLVPGLIDRVKTDPGDAGSLVSSEKS